MTYKGLDARLRDEVYERDGFRCRWCGRTNGIIDIHHVTYRRGPAEDVADNLVCLCRTHHDFVHGRANARGQVITKARAQEILRRVIATPGSTGASLWRQVGQV
jgi:5-methylcytosine-specific restriction endonuclease McrA